MSASQHPVDPRSPLVFDTRALGRRAGAMTTVETSVPAPAGLGTEVIGVPEGSPIELDLRLEAVVEGVLVTGTADLEAVGECVRCLTEVRVPVEVDVQELFVHDGSTEAGYAEDDEVSLMSGDHIDLEPVLRDDVVLDLPFQPLCSPDCSGLCPTCGARLDDDPDHHHDAATDPRWAALGGWAGEDGDEAAETDTDVDARAARLEQRVLHPYNQPGPAQGEDVSR
jgi:uncharacterized protein